MSCLKCPTRISSRVIDVNAKGARPAAEMFTEIINPFITDFLNN